jgi:hypothetical protein
MTKNDFKLLLSIDDRIIAEDIQSVLDGFEIYTMLDSDNPASSVLNAYLGSNPCEEINIIINSNDYQRAIDILNDSPYRELIANK